MERERDSRVHDTLERQRQHPVPPEVYMADFADPDPDGPTALNVDFHGLLRAQQRQEERPRMEVWEVDVVLDFLEKTRRLVPFYTGVIKRIKDETNYFHEYEELGLFEWIDRGFDEFAATFSQVYWEAWNPVDAGRGIHRFKSGETRIKGNMPERSSILGNLAIFGSLPIELTALAHEITHSLQAPSFAAQLLSNIYEHARFLPPVLKRALLKEYIQVSSFEMFEIQAYQLASRKGLERDRVRLAEHLINTKRQNGELVYLYFNQDKVIYGVTAVEQLDVLGFSVEEIARLIGKPGRWDRKRGVYPKVQKVINTKARELGLDENDLENLVLAHRIERDTDRLRAMHIVQEELRKVQIAKGLPREDK